MAKFRLGAITAALLVESWLVLIPLLTVRTSVSTLNVSESIKSISHPHWRPVRPFESRFVLLNMIAKSVREYIFWGMKFGGVATVFSTGFFILFGILFNYSHGISSGTESLLGLGFVIPGALVLGTIFIILFSPAILVAGPLYGLIAMKLKQLNLSEH